MKTGPTAFKVGIFVLVAISIGIGALVALGAGAFVHERILVETYLRESVHGLSIGSPVKLRGVQIGKVEAISFGSMRYPDEIQMFEDDPDRELWGQCVVVVSAIDPRAILPTSDLNIESLIKDRVENEGLRVQLALEGISGLLYVEVDYGLGSEEDLRQPPWRPLNPVVPAVSSLKATFGETLTNFLADLDELDVGDLVESLETALSEITSVARGIDVDGVQRRLTTLLDELSGSAQRVNTVLDRIEEDQLVQVAAGAFDEVDGAAASLTRVLDDLSTDLTPAIAGLRSTAERLESLLATPGLDTALADFGRTSANLAATTDELPGLVAAGRQSFDRIDLVLSAGQDDLAQLIENLRRTAEHLERLTAIAAGHPSGALFGDPPPPARATR